MIISKHSIHFKYYTFLKKIQYLLFTNVFNFDQSNPIPHYLFFNQIKWCKYLSSKFKITIFNFSFHTDLFKLFVLFIKRSLLYQLWGSFIAFILITYVKSLISFSNEPAISVFNIFHAVSTGILPIFILILIFGIFHTIWQCLKYSFMVFKWKENSGFKVNVSHNTIFYIIYLLFAPVLIGLLVFLELLSRISISSIYYIVIGVKWFVELIWLFINMMVLILRNIIHLFTSILKKINASRDDKPEIIRQYLRMDVEE